MSKEIFVSIDDDGMGAVVGKCRLNNDIEGLTRISRAIEEGNKLFTDFATNNLGRPIEAGGDECCFSIPADKLPEIPPLSAQYHQLTGHTVTIGVGFDLASSSKALLIGKVKGGKDCICVWQPEMQAAIDEMASNPISEKDKEVQAYLGQDDTDHLAKAADPADIQQRLEPQVPKSKPHAPKLKSMNMGDNDEQPPINHEEEFHKIAQQQNAKDLHEKANSKEKLAQIKEGVVQTLNNIRQQLPDIAQLKQTAPDAYNSIVELTQRVVELGQITMKQMPKTNKSETLAKAISTLPPGKRLSAELKPHPTANGAKVFKRTVDYSHLLPEYVRNTGFQLHVEHKNVMLPKGVKSIPTSMTSPNIRPVGPSETIRSILKTPDNKEVGYVIGHVYDKKRGKAIEPHSDLDAPYRGKGLGTAMYEAAYAHAKNTGVNRVEGGVHSKDAHALHTRLAQKHGFHYRSNMWLDPKTKEPDEYFPYKPYSYALKSESFVENEDGFLGIGHGPIFYRDGVEMQKDEPKPEAVEGQPRRMGANSGGAQAGRAHQNLPIGTMLNQKVKIINGITGLANWRSVKGGTIASQQHNPPILGANSTPTSANNPDR